MLGAFTLIGTIFSGTLAFLSNRHAKVAKTEATQANTAVNHRKDGELSMIDMVVDMHNTINEFSWWKPHVDSQISNSNRRIDHLSTHIHELNARLAEVEEHQWDGTERRKRQHHYDGDNRRQDPQESS